MGLLGQMMNSRQAAPSAAAPAPNMALQQAFTTCVQNANGAPTVIQACTSILQGTAAQPQMAPQMAPQMMAPAMPAGMAVAGGRPDAAMATYAAAQNYHACVAANPTNWQACVQSTMGPGASVGAAVGVPAGAPGVPAGLGGAIGAAAPSAMKALGGLFGR